jgi:rhamnosyltransferase
MIMKTDNLPKVAVLLAAYNGMQWIKEQIDTVFNQQNVDVTIYISVDLSTDGTYKWAEQLAEKHTNVVLLPYGERFGGAGPNFFRLVKDVEFSGFDAVSFADQDDIWHPEKLAKAYSKIATGQCDVYSSNVTAFWADGRECLIKKSQPQKKLDHFFEAAGPGCTYVSAKLLCKRLRRF